MSQLVRFMPAVAFGVGTVAVATGAGIGLEPHDDDADKGLNVGMLTSGLIAAGAGAALVGMAIPKSDGVSMAVIGMLMAFGGLASVVSA